MNNRPAIDSLMRLLLLALLPSGTIDDVCAAVARVRAAFDDGRGGVIAQCEWGPHYPADNIRAVFEAWDRPRK